MRVTGEGFAPNTMVKVWIFSEPTEAAEVLSDDEGRVDAVVEMPAELALGQHTVQLNGVTPRGDVRSINVGVMLVPSTVTDGADTPEVSSAEIGANDGSGIGTALTALAAVAALIGLAVAALAVARRPRRRTPQT